jgi:hypothetical protein
MSGFPILDLVIGLIFVYFLLSIICSSAVELWFSLLKTRARLLEQWLVTIFNSPALDSSGLPVLDSANKPVSVGKEIMNHCMVTALSKTGKSTSYIDAENFVSALLDKITISPAATGVNAVQLPPTKLADYITAIQNSTLISGELKRTILILANEASQAASVLKNVPGATNVTNNITGTIRSELDIFRDRLERWYDTNADRLTGTLKRTKAIPSTFILACIITVLFNTDSIQISKYLYNNKDVSKQLATTAMNTYSNYKVRLDTVMQRSTTNASTGSNDAIKQLSDKTDQLKNDIAKLNSLDLPLGWEGVTFTKTYTFWDYFFQWKHIVGWLATILAICMGAPFWFDLLNKIANLRSSGPKPSSSSDAAVKNT